MTKYRIVDGPDGQERYIRDDRPVEPPVEETCGNCRFWPELHGKHDAEWCGQWEAKR